jgi:hypothetical protein
MNKQSFMTDTMISSSPTDLQRSSLLFALQTSASGITVTEKNSKDFESCFISRNFGALTINFVSRLGRFKCMSPISVFKQVSIGKIICRASNRIIYFLKRRWVWLFWAVQYLKVLESRKEFELVFIAARNCPVVGTSNGSIEASDS